MGLWHWEQPEQSAAAEDKVDTIMRHRKKAIKWKHKQCCSDCGFVVCGMAMAY